MDDHYIRTRRGVQYITLVGHKDAEIQYALTIDEYHKCHKTETIYIINNSELFSEVLIWASGYAALVSFSYFVTHKIQRKIRIRRRRVCYQLQKTIYTWKTSSKDIWTPWKN